MASPDNTLQKTLSEATIKAREEAMHKKVTLDGIPASVTGKWYKFAIVRTLDGKRTAEYAWETVFRVISKSKAFRT